MATTVKQILASAYVLLNSANERELDYVIALQQYVVVATEMQNERILGIATPEIVKGTITFTGQTGIANETLTDFVEDAVYLEFDDEAVPHVPVNMLDIYRNNGQQAVSFFKDWSTGSSVAKCQLALERDGDLTVWYEPRQSITKTDTGNIQFDDTLAYLMAVRIAYNCGKYVNFESPHKEANKLILLQGLAEQASYAKDLIKEKLNRIDNGNRPFARIPFVAG
jgi:hypothetical protein